MATTLADLIRNPDPNWSKETLDAIKARAEQLNGTLRVFDNNQMFANGQNVSDLSPNVGYRQPMMPDGMPENYIQRGNNPPIPIQPSPRSMGPALDYSSAPVDFGGMKGYRVKGDPLSIVMADGRIVRMGADTGADRKRMADDLQMQMTRQKLSEGNVDEQLKRAQLAELMNPKKSVGFTSMKDIFDAENKLADDHKSQSKDFISVRDAYSRLDSAMSKATSSAPAALAGATTFMKLLDPGSVVRESELGMALAATGTLDRMQNYFNTLKNGKVLTESQANEFREVGKKLYEAAAENQRTLDTHYTGRAKTYGLDPTKVIGDYYIKTPTAPQGATPQGATPQTSGKSLPPVVDGWVLHTDKNGKMAYVSPDGKQFREVP